MPLTAGRYGHARIAVLSVIKEETEAVRNIFRLTQRVTRTHYYVSPGQPPQSPEIVNCEIGRNNVQSGEAIRDVIEHWQPQVLVLVGIAGGIDGYDDISVGDIVVPDYVHYAAFAKLSAGGQQRRFIAYDHPAIQLHRSYAAPLRDDESWITDDLIHQLPRAEKPKVHIAGLVAGDKVYGDPSNEEQALLLNEFGEVAAAIDMESVGLCRSVAAARSNPQYNPRLLIVRGISDLVGQTENNEIRKQYKPVAALVAATFARRVVDDILTDEPDPRLPQEEGGFDE
ncbi:5'-methylthioadenosine/S-adenosylhomocysteine nucleosidase family protein [Actinomadura napierensis]|uniref:Nucleoside phosphorylase domain-containing protein n=1 Tax=Actinomadura napierensis TaxID=267854 RepID=A0ABP5L4I0_9ACTN